MCDCTPPDVHMVRVSLGPSARSWSGFSMKLDLVVVNMGLCAGAEVATGTTIRMLGVLTQQGRGDSQGPRQVAMTAALADEAAVPGAAAVAIMQALVSLHKTLWLSTKLLQLSCSPQQHCLSMSRMARELC